MPHSEGRPLERVMVGLLPDACRTIARVARSGLERSMVLCSACEMPPERAVLRPDERRLAYRVGPGFPRTSLPDPVASPTPRKEPHAKDAAKKTLGGNGRRMRCAAPGLERHELRRDEPAPGQRRSGTAQGQRRH